MSLKPYDLGKDKKISRGACVLASYFLIRVDRMTFNRRAKTPENLKSVSVLGNCNPGTFLVDNKPSWNIEAIYCNKSEDAKVKTLTGHKNVLNQVTDGASRKFL